MGRMKYFRYGEREMSHLKARDKKLAAVIDAVGPIRRELDTDLFSAVVRHIVGQQLSNKALSAVWGRLADGLATFDDYLMGGGIGVKREFGTLDGVNARRGCR